MQSGERYICPAFVKTEVLPGKFLLAFPSIGKVGLFDETETQIFITCNELKTLLEHSADAVRSGRLPREITPGHVIGCLQKAVSDGILLRQNQLVSPEYLSSASLIDWLAIPTAGNVSQVARAIKSYLGNAKFYGRKFRVFVSSDSCLGEFELRLLGRIAKNFGFRIFYAGPKEKRLFTTRLAADFGIPSESMELALFGFGNNAITTGANRNAILLQTVGSLVFSADDDTLCRPGSIQGTPNEFFVSVRGHHNPQDYWLFSDRRSALGFVERIRADVISRHELMLGATVQNVLTRQAGPLQMEGPCAHMIELLMSRRGRIVLTFNGAVGDAGIQSGSSTVFQVSNSIRRSIRDSPVQSLQNLRSREIVRQAPSFCVGHGPAGGQTMFFGFDNRTVLPPFFPSYRNEDGLFGLLTDRCIIDACVAHIPLVLQHHPPAARGYSGLEDNGLRVCDWIAASCRSWSASPASTSATHLRLLGRHLTQLGQLKDREFAALLMPILYSDLAHRLQSRKTFQALSNYEPLRAAFAQDLDGMVSVAASPKFLEPLDMVGDKSGFTFTKRIRRMVREYGELLMCWPAAIDATSALKASGVGVGIELKSP